MKRYAHWLWRRLVSRRPPVRRTVPASVWPRAVQPPLANFGFDLEQLRGWLADLSIDGGPKGALAGYARQDLERFLRTVELVPDTANVGLEIGANPYFTTTLLRWLRPDLRLSLTNYFGRPGVAGEQRVLVEGAAGVENSVLSFHAVNVETDNLPFDAASFDVVLYCEVLEHMTDDPVATLWRIRRVLKPGGSLILTTPNAARLENVARLAAGLNVHDQYSGYGPYGRHNREYTVDEVRALLRHCGFEEEILYTADVHDNHAAIHLRDPRWLERLCGSRPQMLGQYIFSRWRRCGGDAAETRPTWLYRSLPESARSDDIPLTEPLGARH